mgnify:CR=1 FL=1
MSEKILQIGAEATIIKDGETIIKKRERKSYRIPEIDEKIRRLRTRSEGKLLDRVSKLIDTPKIRKIDEKSKEILMNFVDGKRLSNSLDNFPLDKQKEICGRIGESVAKLHSSNVIHGDLTTSNMIYVKDDKNLKGNVNNKDSRLEIKSDSMIDNLKDGGLQSYNFKVFFIDFGLGFISHKIEDKAVDLHLFREALEAKHFKYWKTLFKEFLKGYEKYSEHKKVLEQLRKVEKRGRYKEQY